VGIPFIVFEFKVPRLKLFFQFSRRLTEKDVYSVLEALSESTNGFSSQKIRQIIAEQLAIGYRNDLRNWAGVTSTWSGGTASLVAATYTRDLDGLKELVGSPFSDALRKAQVISKFLEMVAVPQLPYGFVNTLRTTPTS
jgi:hypothetical protein